MLTRDYTKVIANLLAGNSAYMPNYLYVEFSNSSEPTIPTDNQGREYFDQLSDVGYLRIPITIKPSISGNILKYTVLTTDKTSANNTVFGNDSVIYGVALVSAIDPEDPTQDIVFAREYFTDPNKQLVMTNDQIFCFSFQLALFADDTTEESLEWDNEGEDGEDEEEP